MREIMRDTRPRSRHGRSAFKERRAAIDRQRQREFVITSTASTIDIDPVMLARLAALVMMDVHGGEQ